MSGRCHPCVFVASGFPGEMQVGLRGGAEKALDLSLKTEPIGAMKGGDVFSIGVMMEEERETMELAPVDPPWWEPNGNPVPGSRCMTVVASACTTVNSLGDFFRCHLAAEVEKHAWSMAITAFLDYVAVRMKVEVHRNTDADSHTIVIFHHMSQDDIVQFNHVCSLAIKYLSERNLQVSELGGKACSLPMLSDDDIDSDPFQFEEDWPVLLESAFEAMSDPERSVREQGVQALARWAERDQGCVPALADALIRHGALMGGLLRGPLAEGYPLAVTLKFASRCPHEAARLSEKVLPLLPWPNAVRPTLVARELEETFKNLITPAVAAGQGTYKDLDKPPEPFEEDISGTSTCTGDGGCFSRSVSAISSLWEPQKSSQEPQWINEKSDALVLNEEEGDFAGDFI